MRISIRDKEYTKAYLGGGPYVNTVPYPTSPMIPALGDPYTYELIKIRCPECGPEKGKKYANSEEVICCGCNNRISLDFIDKSFSPNALNPSTLNAYQGGNTNNEAGGVQYHQESPNQDTWTGVNRMGK